MFDIATRDRIRDLLIDQAHADPHIVAAALVGSTATGGDRWSDLDLTFGVALDVPLATVLDAWTERMITDFGAVALFDLPVGATVYRVFHLPGGLQVDLSFSPATAFGPRSPRFRLLFGQPLEVVQSPPPTPAHVFGLGVHYLFRGHTYIERGLLLQAEHWIHEARYQALTLACLRLGLDTAYGRGLGGLPLTVTDPLAAALVRELTVPELRRALAVATAGVLREASTMPDLVRQVEPLLAEVIN